MGLFTGYISPKKTFDLKGRRYWWYEIEGADIQIADEFEIPTGKNNIPDLCTVTYFGMSADGVALLDPFLARDVGADLDSLQLEVRNKTPEVRIHNQQPACLVLQNHILVVRPNADTDGLNLKITIVLAEGHDTRGT